MAKIEVLKDDKGKALEVRVTLDDGRVAIAPASNVRKNDDVPPDLYDDLDKAVK